MQSHYRISRIQRGVFNGEKLATFQAHYMQPDGTWRDCGRFSAPVRAPRSTLWRYVYVRARVVLDATSASGVRILSL
jgi:hypothetical protein